MTAAKDGLKLVQKEVKKGKWNEGNGIEKQQGVFMTEIELEDQCLQINEKLFKYLSKSFSHSLEHLLYILIYKVNTAQR